MAHAVFKYIPALDSLRTYSFDHFRRDVLSGLTVAAVAVPQAMAYATIFDMPIKMGLYTAIVMTTVGALLDSSKQLINGPTNVICIAMLSALAGVEEGSRIQAAILMAFMVGLIQTAIALLRFGDLSRFISNSVIVGFTLGASILLLLEQTKHILGLKAQGSDHDHLLVRFWNTLLFGGGIHWPTVGIAVLTIAVALAIRWTNKRFRIIIPELLLAIAMTTTLVAFADPEGSLRIRLQDQKSIANLPRELPSFAPPDFDWGLIRNLSSSAAAIAFLGLLEALAMAKSIASKTGQKLDMNQQCLSEGVANMAGSFFQCFPGSGSLTRSYINHLSGAATQWSGVISAVGVAATILFFAPLAQYVPKAALAAVLVLTAARMNDFKLLRYYFDATRFDRWILIATALSAILISVEFCILIGVFLSFAFFARAARIKVHELILTNERVIRESTPNDLPCSYLRVINVEGEMFFGCGPEFEKQLEKFVDEAPDQLKVIVMRLKRANNPDAVCMDVLERFIVLMKNRGVLIMLSGIRMDMMRTLSNVGIDQLVGEENVFPEESEIWVSTFNAIKKGYSLLDQKRCEHCPNRAIAREERGDWSYMI